MNHKHEFKKRIVSFHSCDCGADGQACEACGKLTDLDLMHSDSEGCWLCPGCWDELVKETLSPERLSSGDLETREALAHISAPRAQGRKRHG